MSGIYIPGMAMTKKGCIKQLLLICDGSLFDVTSGCQPPPEEQNYKAVPVPPHGRLIDGDEFFKALSMDDRVSILEAMHVQSILSDTPTVIQTESEGE